MSGGRARMAKATTDERPKVSRSSQLEERVALFIAREGLPVPVREFRFAPPRMFRFDFCWPTLAIALEIQGGIWIRGAHSRGMGLADDCDKLNLATLRGWRVFKVTDRQLKDGSAFGLIRAFLTTEIRYVPTTLGDLPAAKAQE